VSFCAKVRCFSFRRRHLSASSVMSTRAAASGGQLSAKEVVPTWARRVPTLSGGVGGGAGAAAKGGPVERKDGARQAARRAVAVAVDHAGIHGGAGEWRSRLGKWIFFKTSEVELLARRSRSFGLSRPTTTEMSGHPDVLSVAFPFLVCVSTAFLFYS
jgi:hypothetical protein